MQRFAKLVKSRKAKLNKLYDTLNDPSPHPLVQRGLELCKLQDSPNTRLAMLRRLVDLKEEALSEEFNKRGFKQSECEEKKDLLYTLVSSLYEVEHEDLIAQAKPFLDEFELCVVQGVHKLGIIFNAFTRSWQKNIIYKNHALLQSEFASLQDVLVFLDKNKLYQTNEEGKKADRAYGGLLKFGSSWSMQPYAKLFADHVSRLDYEFSNLLEKLQSFELNPARKSYIKYFSLLRHAFNEKDNAKCILAWQDVEFAWMEIKGPLQIGHPLEYYEDPYAKSVALEWDLRIKDDYPFDVSAFETNIKKSFKHIYDNLGVKDEALFNKVNASIDKTQCYICLPALYYGANLNGLFSAQVVPNDEFVSSQTGKKIFAFLNHVYNSSKAAPFMKLPSMVLPKDFLDYTRDILFFQEDVWKKTYEVSTIGHEYGHILFIGDDTEARMQASGVFKNIEEFKATMGGLINFFLHEEKELIKPVFAQFISRTIGLIAWQRVLDVRPYYCEGLIGLELLFSSNTLSFEENKLSIDLEKYDTFKAVAMQRYEELASNYLARKDAKEFLDRFAVMEGEYYLPTNPKIKEFVNWYYALYEKHGNEVDKDPALEKYKK